MAKAFLVSLNASVQSWWSNFERLKKVAKSQSAGNHSLVEDPDEADIVLFLDSNSITQADVRSHPLARKFPRKAFVYSTNDHEIPFVPGVYTSVERRWYRPASMRAGYYLKVIDHDLVQPTEVAERTRNLYSFVGSFDTHPLRRRLGLLLAGGGEIRDTSADDARREGQPAEIYRQWQSDYADSIAGTRFVLCPRGVAPSSYRIFEAMKAGRVPVIISDAWVAPQGPPWDEFSIRVPEANASSIPSLLERRAGEAATMGRRARQEWDRWFAEDRAFETIVTWCVDIQGNEADASVFDRISPYVQLARPFNIRHVMLPLMKRGVSRFLGSA